MALRKDSKKTREKLLSAACEVFAKKGYRDTRVAEICKRAGTNVASVNYYFGSKAALYAEAWKRAFEKEALVEPDPSADIAPEDRLRQLIGKLLGKFCRHGGASQFNRMYLMELANPTGLIRENWRKLIESRRRQLLGILRELMGEGASEERVFLCEISIINQCRGFLILDKADVEYLVQQPFTPELMEKIADHITRFSLAAIKAGGQWEKICK